MKMTIKEFTESYYLHPKSKLERLALENLVEEVIGSYYCNTIINALKRGRILTIRDLYEAKENQIKAIDYVGNMRFQQIMKIKSVIDQNVTKVKS